MNWETYLLNEFLCDCKYSQDIGALFNYSWILIIISFVAWAEPQYYQSVEYKGYFLVSRYENLNHTKNMQRKVDNTIIFIDINNQFNKMLCWCHRLKHKWLVNLGSSLGSNSDLIVCMYKNDMIHICNGVMYLRCV